MNTVTGTGIRGYVVEQRRASSQGTWELITFLVTFYFRRVLDSRKIEERVQRVPSAPHLVFPVISILH